MYKYLVNSNAIQPSFQFPLNFIYEDSVDPDDISRTVKEVVEGVNVFKFIDFSHRNSYGYDGVKMLECVLLAFALNGYASTRVLEDLCKYDIRFQFIMEGFTGRKKNACKSSTSCVSTSVLPIFLESQAC